MSAKEKQNTIGSVLLGGYLRLKGKLPLGYHYFWGDFFAWILRTVGYRREVILINLSRSFPDKKYKEIRRMLKDVYRHFGEIIAETIWFGGVGGKKGAARLHRQHLVHLTNPEEFNAFCARCPRGAMTLNSHLSNWELYGGFFNYNYDEKHPLLAKPSQIAIAYKELHSRTWDIILRKNRCRVLEEDFDGYIESNKIVRFAVQHRHEQKIFIFITDQHPYKGSARVDIGQFMHQPTDSMIAAASLASRFGMGVAYVRWKRVKRGRYDMTIVPMYDDAERMDPTEITKDFYRRLEQDINADPTSYLWTHKRWK